MATHLTADTGTDNMAAALTQASDELESIVAENDQLADQFGNHGWSGLEALGTARQAIASVRDNLADVADKIGVGGAAVRDARIANQMATYADTESLGRS